MQWYDLYSEITNYLGTKEFKAVLEDEPEYYYEGRFSVSGYKPGDSASNTRSTITVSYTLDPYKWHKQTTTDEWVWDTFNFEHGVIFPKILKGIEVNGTEVKKTFGFREMGYAPVKPVITCTPQTGQTVKVVLNNKTLNIQETIEVSSETTVEAKNFIAYGEVELTLTGYGTVSVNFRQGRL